MATFSLAINLARRELRGGLQAFRHRHREPGARRRHHRRRGLACLRRSRQASSADARAILGGDAEFRLAYREADATEQAALSAAGGRVSHAMELRAMVKVADSRRGADLG